YGCGDHTGRDYYAIDFQMSTGDPVAAVATGIAHPVDQTDRSGKLIGYGHFIWIDHGGGVVSIYGHLSAQQVADGQSVAQGQTIGAAGSSGNSTGPHLHFVMHSSGKSWSDGNPLLA